MDTFSKDTAIVTKAIHRPTGCGVKIDDAKSMKTIAHKGATAKPERTHSGITSNV